MRLKIIALLAALALLVVPGATANNTCFIVGDSLSKEYSDEGPFLWRNLVLIFPPDYTDYNIAIKARNWMEILIALRGTDFDFGYYSGRTDSRLPGGHDHNWAVPSSTTDQWRDALNGTSILQQFVLADFDSDLRSNINRVVIFLGGNDLNKNYDTYYKGADPTGFIADLLSNYSSIVQHIKSVNNTAQIVICTAPDVGATPNVRSDHTDATKRARVTALTETLNAGIAQLATEQGLGLADIYAFTKLYASTGIISIAGIPLTKGTSSQNVPSCLFSEDGFHPNTPGQALLANEIIRAFNHKFQAGIKPLTGYEIMDYLETQHGVTLNASYATWATAYGLTQTGKLNDPDHDGLTNGLEYALGLDPSKPDNPSIPSPQITQVSGTAYLTLTYSPRWRYVGHEIITPQFSGDLSSWSAVPAGAVTNNGDGSFTAAVPLSGTACFLRLNISISN